MLPRLFRGIGQCKKLVERFVGDGFRPKPRPRYPAQLQLGPDNQTSEPDAADGGREPVGGQVRAALDGFAIRAGKP